MCGINYTKDFLEKLGLLEKSEHQKKFDLLLMSKQNNKLAHQFTHAHLLETKNKYLTVI